MGIEWQAVERRLARRTARRRALRAGTGLLVLVALALAAFQVYGTRPASPPLVADDPNPSTTTSADPALAGGRNSRSNSSGLALMIHFDPCAQPNDRTSWSTGRSWGPIPSVGTARTERHGRPPGSPIFR